MKIAALGALLLCAAAPAVAQTTPVEDYQISGAVVDHLTNQPLHQVLVQIVRTGKAGGDASALTSDDGRFTFLHLPKGKYRLTAQKRGQRPQGFHADGVYSTAIVVDGQHKTDGIVFSLRPDSSIRGVVTGDDGEPVRNAQVHLFRQNVADGEAQTVQLSQDNTDSTGQFHFGHLQRGNYYLAASGTPWYSQAGSGSDMAYPVTFYGGTSDANATQAIALGEGASLNVPMSLRAVPAIRVKVAEKSRGIQLFAAGPGDTRIPVNTMFSGVADRFISPAGGGLSSAIVMNDAREDRQTELTGIAAGRYEVVMFGEDGNRQQVNEMVDLSNGSTLMANLAAPSVVAGKLLFDGPRPSGDLQVLLGDGRIGMEAEVAADGTFKFDKVAAGSYQVHQNNAALLISSVTAQGGRMIHDKVEVPAGATVNLTVRALPSENLISLEGFAVRNDTGAPGVMVLLLPQDRGRDRLIRRDQSDSDGSFSLPRVLPGKYILVAIDDGNDLAYKTESVIRPYLASGVAVTVPLSSNEPIKAPVQPRRR